MSAAFIHKLDTFWEFPSIVTVCDTHGHLWLTWDYAATCKNWCSRQHMNLNQ